MVDGPPGGHAPHHLPLRGALTLSRRRLLQLGSAGVALAAVGTGVAVQRRRAAEALRSSRIVGPWEELLPGAQWLLPDLHDAPMVVPDRPHTHAEATDATARAAIHRTRSFTVTTGAQRLRGGDPTWTGARRVIALGDSVTFGWGVATDQAWPARLAAKLGVDVVNAGVPAQRLEVMAAWLQKHGAALQPDLVVLVRRPYPDAADPIQAYAHAVASMKQAVPRAKLHVFLSPVSRFDVHGQAVGDQEAAGLRAALDVPVLDLTAALRTAQGDAGWGVHVDGADLVLARVDGSGTPLRAPAPPADLPRAFYDALEAGPDVREALFFDEGHPDADGLDVVAETIAASVRADLGV